MQMLFKSIVYSSIKPKENWTGTILELKTAKKTMMNLVYTQSLGSHIQALEFLGILSWP